MKTALLTGASSGLGRALAERLLDRDWQVFGCSRRGCDLDGIHDLKIDLTDFQAVSEALPILLQTLSRLDLAVLNAGTLGEIRDLSDTPMADAKQVMEINLWANKALMDQLHAWRRPIGQIVLISSGASILGNRGWGGYSLSKAALNMLAKLYAHEFADTHICALAPGIVDTPMMDALCQADVGTFPALQRLHLARGTDAMPTPRQAAEQILTVLPQLRQRPSGSFVDIREILQPALYASLFGQR